MWWLCWTTFPRTCIPCHSLCAPSLHSTLRASSPSPTRRESTRQSIGRYVFQYWFDGDIRISYILYMCVCVCVISFLPTSALFRRCNGPDCQAACGGGHHLQQSVSRWKDSCAHRHRQGLVVQLHRDGWLQGSKVHGAHEALSHHSHVSNKSTVDTTRSRVIWCTTFTTHVLIDQESETAFMTDLTTSGSFAYFRFFFCQGLILLYPFPVITRGVTCPPTPLTWSARHSQTRTCPSPLECAVSVSTWNPFILCGWMMHKTHNACIIWSKEHETFLCHWQLLQPFWLPKLISTVCFQKFSCVVSRPCRSPTRPR